MVKTMVSCIFDGKNPWVSCKFSPTKPIQWSHLFKGHPASPQLLVGAKATALPARDSVGVRGTWNGDRSAHHGPTIVPIKMRNWSCQNFGVSETWSVYGSIYWMFDDVWVGWFTALETFGKSQLQGMKCVSWLACQLPRDLGIWGWGMGSKLGIPAPKNPKKPHGWLLFGWPTSSWAGASRLRLAHLLYWLAFGCCRQAELPRLSQWLDWDFSRSGLMAMNPPNSGVPYTVMYIYIYIFIYLFIII